MYLIDTDVMVYALNGRPGVIGRFRANAHAPKAISVITYGELLYGANKSTRRDQNVARVRHIPLLLSIVDVDRGVMEIFSSLRLELQRRGKPVDDFDLVIACTALSLGYRLVTNNVRHFENVPGLEIENWTKG
jgi:tRNA(fMet)-specific endonuclease VapC